MSIKNWASKLLCSIACQDKVLARGSCFHTCEKQHATAKYTFQYRNDDNLARSPEIRISEVARRVSRRTIPRYIPVWKFVLNKYHHIVFIAGTFGVQATPEPLARFRPDLRASFV